MSDNSRMLNRFLQVLLLAILIPTVVYIAFEDIKVAVAITALFFYSGLFSADMAL